MLLILLSLSLLATIISQVSPLPTYTVYKRIPAAVYGAGQFTLNAQGSPIAVLDNGITFQFQITDSNFAVYRNGVVQWDSGVTEPAGCTTNQCVLSFQPDGNLVSYFNGVPTWFTGTGSGQGAWLVFFDIEPYIVIYNAANQPIWHTPITPPAAASPSSPTTSPGAAAHRVSVFLVPTPTPAHSAASPNAPAAPPTVISVVISSPSGTAPASNTPSGNPHIIPITSPENGGNSGGGDGGSGGGDDNSGGGDDNSGGGDDNSGGGDDGFGGGDDGFGGGDDGFGGADDD